MQQDPVVLAFLLVTQHEGFRDKAYQDTGGRWTIGFGRTENVKEGDVTTLDAETAWTKQRLVLLRDKVDHAAGRDLNPNQMAALLDFAYNLGLSALLRSTLFSYVQSGQWLPASLEFEKWSKSHVDGQVVTLPGLLRRRKAERDLFTSPPTENKP